MRKFPLLKMKEKWNLFVESWKSIDTMYVYILVIDHDAPSVQIDFHSLSFDGGFLQ